MNPTGGFNGALSPDAVKTAIDGVMYEEFTRVQAPGYLSVTDSFFFKQDVTNQYAFIWEEDSNVGRFQKTEEQEEIYNTDTFIANQKTKFSQKYTKQIPVSDEAFRADKVSKRNQIGKQVGDRARVTRDSFGILETYGDAFAGSVNTTPDGQALASNSHVTTRGQTVDTLETGAFTPDNAWTMTVSLASQLGQDGDLGGHVFEGTVVPFLLYKTAREVLNSTLIPNSAENNLNIFDTDFGAVQIAASAFLGSAGGNTATNANTSYHFLGRNHAIVRQTFYDLTSSLIPPESTVNDSYVFRYKFHETTFPGTWTGYVGSNGTTA